MPYIVKAQCAKEIGVFTKRLNQWPILRALWIIVSFLLVGICYVGIFFAAFFVALLPLKLLRLWRFTPAEVMYWVVEAIILTVIVGMSCFLAVMVYRHLKAYRVNIDLMVLFAGSLLAVWYALRTLPFGW
jgi:hypothetical protein